MCDLSVGPAIFRHSRFQVIDYLHPWLTEPAKLLIPMPVFVNDSSAFFKPFTFTVRIYELQKSSKLTAKLFQQVWMVVLVSLLLMITLLMLLDYIKGPLAGSNNPKLDFHWLFVIGSVFGQGK